MKYTALFVTLCVIIIIICGIGIGFIIYQQNPNRYYLKGVSSFQSGNYETAIEAFNEYLSFGYDNPQSEKARYYLAASVDRLRALTVPANLPPGVAAERYLEENVELAKRRYLDVINNNRNNTFRIEAIIGYAEICRRQNEYDRFITTKLEDSLKAVPDSKLEDQLHMLLGYQYFFAGDYRKAMNEFLQSASELAKLGQARVHIEMNQYESAFRIYEDFLTFFPASIHIEKVRDAYRRQVLYYADLHKKQNRLLEAIPFYARLVRYFPDEEVAETARLRIGECYFGLRNFEMAIASFQEAATDATHAHDDSALFNIGLSYYELGKYVEAYQSFNLLLSQFPASVYVGRAQQWVRQLKKDLEYFNN